MDKKPRTALERQQAAREKITKNRERAEFMEHIKTCNSCKLKFRLYNARKSGEALELQAGVLELKGDGAQRFLRAIFGQSLDEPDSHPNVVH